MVDDMADDMFAAPRAADVSFEAMLGCVDRELKMRAKVYPRWVSSGKLSKEGAAVEVLRLRAVRQTLLCYKALCETIGDLEGPDNPLFVVALARLIHQHPEPLS